MYGDHAEADNHRKTEKRPVANRNRDVELDCRSIVNQLVSSIPKDVLLRTSYVECQQPIATQTAQEVNVELRSSVTRRIQFTDKRRSTNRARTVHLETKHCPGCHAPSGPDKTTCPGRQYRSDQGTEFCPGSRETS